MIVLFRFNLYQFINCFKVLIKLNKVNFFNSLEFSLKKLLLLKANFFYYENNYNSKDVYNKIIYIQLYYSLNYIKYNYK